LTVVALRTDGFIEDLFVNKTGQHVKEGEPPFLQRRSNWRSRT
jgi:hypothetical protein